MRLLFVTSTRIGDAVLSTGLLGWLLEQYPEAVVTIACGPPAAPLFEAVPGLERVIVLGKRRFGLHWLGLWRACAGRRWDLVVDLRRSALPWLLRAEARQRLPRSNALLHRVVLIARSLNLEPPPAPRLWTTPQHEQAAEQMLAGLGPFLALAPAANWAAKTWPAERFAALARHLTGPGGPLAGVRVAILCGPREAEGLGSLLEAIPEADRITVAGAPLLTVFALLRRAELFVGNDSGLMHMAAAAGIPTLGLFGPSDERLYAPWGARSAALRTPETVSELLGRAAQGAEGSLMETLTVQEVEVAALALLERVAAS